jgi:predicted S18 family serine protease
LDGIVGHINYFPTYFHLHVHFKSEQNEYSRIYSLKEVIDELKNDSDYYKNAKLNTLCRSRKIAEALTNYAAEKSFENVEEIELESNSLIAWMYKGCSK